MPDQNDALTRLVQEHVGRGRRLTLRAFEEQAVDPISKRRLSKSLAGNIVQGHQIKVTPEVLRAIAAGIGESLATVRAAAIQQYIGIEVTDPFQTPPGDDDTVLRVAHEVGASAEDLQQVRHALGNSEPEGDSR
ncbi:hypothetical protein ACH4C6_21855 [Streptomyces sp. NPDC017943]|uniref:hypothetical protein n=1 Tax=Streptomyces sp. NPDC017943 TaxID=3365019 RepID=UPI00378D2B9D